MGGVRTCLVVALLVVIAILAALALSWAAVLVYTSTPLPG